VFGNPEEEKQNYEDDIIELDVPGNMG